MIVVLATLATLAVPAEFVPIDGTNWVEVSVAVRVDADPKGLTGLGAVVGHAVEGVLRDSPRGDATWRVERHANGLVVRGGAPAERIGAAIDEVFVALVGKSLDDEIVERAIREAGTTHQRLRLDDRRLAYHELSRVLFSGHPAGASFLGEIVDLASIATADVRAFLKRNVVQKRVRLFIAGRTPEALDEAVEHATVNLPVGTEVPRSTPPKVGSDGLVVVVVDKPQRVRAEALIGWVVTASAATPALRAARSAWSVSSVREGTPDAFVGVQLFGRRGAIGGAMEIVAAEKQLAKTIADALVNRRTKRKRGVVESEVRAGTETVRRQRILDERDARTIVHRRAFDWLTDRPRGTPSSGATAKAFATLVSGEAMVLIVVASATPSLLTELAALPGVTAVSVVAYDNR